MKFSKPLEEGLFLTRYKRFFADVTFRGAKVVAHVANSGSMKGCKEPGSRCLISRAEDPARKLQFSLEAIHSGKSWIGVNTARPNMLIGHALGAGLNPTWAKYTRWASEVKISDDSRLDFALWSSKETAGPLTQAEKKERPTLDFIRSGKQKFHFIEIKNVSMAEGDVALFPDAVTERGQKHIEELIRLIGEGHTAELIYIIQRSDVKAFAPADHIDPRYGKLLRAAQKKKLIINPYVAEISPSGIQLRLEPLEIRL